MLCVTWSVVLLVSVILSAFAEESPMERITYKGSFLIKGNFPNGRSISFVLIAKDKLLVPAYLIKDLQSEPKTISLFVSNVNKALKCEIKSIAKNGDDQGDLAIIHLKTPLKWPFLKQGKICTSPDTAFSNGSQIKSTFLFTDKQGHIFMKTVEGEFELSKRAWLNSKLRLGFLYLSSLGEVADTLVEPMAVLLNSRNQIVGISVVQDIVYTNNLLIENFIPINDQLEFILNNI